MLKEAIQYVHGLGSDSATKAKATIIDKLSTARDVLLEQNGQLVERKAPPPIRGHQVDSVADLCAAAERWNKDPVIWIDRKRVVLCSDDSDCRDRVSLDLRESEVFRAVCKFQDAQPIDQASLVRLFRVEFRRATNASAVLAAVRKLKFRTLTQGHADIQHGNESMGKQVESEVTGAEAIPDTIAVSTNMFSNAGETEFQFKIEMDLEIDAQKQRFLLRALPDDIEDAIEQALGGIRERISDAIPSVPVFFGRP